jgi:hypothetical protein
MVNVVVIFKKMCHSLFVQGIAGSLKLFMYIVHRHDPALAQHLVWFRYRLRTFLCPPTFTFLLLHQDTLGLNPQFFALRWFTTLLSRYLSLSSMLRFMDRALWLFHCLSHVF